MTCQYCSCHQLSVLLRFCQQHPALFASYLPTVSHITGCLSPPGFASSIVCFLPAHSVTHHWLLIPTWLHIPVADSQSIRWKALRQLLRSNSQQLCALRSCTRTEYLCTPSLFGPWTSHQSSNCPWLLHIRITPSLSVESQALLFLLFPIPPREAQISAVLFNKVTSHDSGPLCLGKKSRFVHCPPHPCLGLICITNRFIMINHY